MVAVGFQFSLGFCLTLKERDLEPNEPMIRKIETKFLFT